MSGGVDSSVAAALLVRAGYEVVGCFMRLGSPGDSLDSLDSLTRDDAGGTGPQPSPKLKIGHQGCCSITDAADARLVAAELGVAFYVCNFRREFGRVIDYFVDEYAAGRTPNPCVRCNDWLKFGTLREYASRIGAEFVASGHYARCEGGVLRRAVDLGKDQSYVLFGVARDDLARMLLPIGAMEKRDVRAEAKRLGLPVFDKPDSQEICFVPDQDYAGLVEQRRPEAKRSGDVLDADGTRVGTHEGQHRYTIGQRRGLSLALGKPVYVVSKDVRLNTVTVGRKEDLLARSCVAGEANWLVDAGAAERRVLAKYRYNSPPVPARVRVLDDGHTQTPSGRAGRFAVEFEEPQHAVAPGQAVVLYDEDRVLGGGWIESAQRAG